MIPRSNDFLRRLADFHHGAFNSDTPVACWLGPADPDFPTNLYKVVVNLHGFQQQANIIYSPALGNRRQVDVQRHIHLNFVFILIKRKLIHAYFLE